jgi:hypothetical protein
VRLLISAQFVQALGGAPAKSVRGAGKRAPIN